jgi:hypothetical protein
MNHTSRRIATENRSRSIVPSVRIPLLSPFLSQSQLLYVVMLFAVVLRAGSALLQGNIVQRLPGVYDQISYDMLARRLITGHGFSFAEMHWPITAAGAPTAHWSYLYTLYLSAIYMIAGPQPLVARVFQAVLAGILHCLFAWRIGQRVGGPRVGMISAILSALYIYFFYYAGSLMTETFYIIGILWTLDCALRLLACQRKGEESVTPSKMQRRLWLELGIAIGITVLFRQVFLLFIPFLYLWLWWNLAPRPLSVQSVSRWAKLSSTLYGMAFSTFIVFLIIVPWTLRNYRAFGTFVPLNTNSGYAFFWGNHPIYGTHFVGILPDDGPSYQDLIPKELRHLNEAELDKALLKKGIGFVLDDPVRYILLSLSRTREYFKFWPSPESGTISNLSRVGSFGILLPFMLFGLYVAAKRLWYPTHGDQRASIVLLLLFATFYTLIHLLTWALIRYRLPVDAVLVIFAALGIGSLISRFRHSTTPESVSLQHRAKHPAL